MVLSHHDNPSGSFGALSPGLNDVRRPTGVGVLDKTHISHFTHRSGGSHSGGKHFDFGDVFSDIMFFQCAFLRCN